MLIYKTKNITIFVVDVNTKLARAISISVINKRGCQQNSIEIRIENNELLDLPKQLAVHIGRAHEVSGARKLGSFNQAETVNRRSV